MAEKTAKKKARTPPRRRRAPSKPETFEGQCVATTARGTRCRRRALDDSDRCSVHLGAPVGRPSKLDEQSIERMVNVLKVGGYVDNAAAVGGVSRATFFAWMERGHPDGVRAEDAPGDAPRVLRAEDEPYRDFRRRITQAQADGEARNIAFIARAAPRDWKAAAWILERTHPERYAGPRGRAPRGLADPDVPEAPPVGAGDDAPRFTDDQVGPDGRPL